MNDRKPMESPFKNDPFAIVWMAFKNLYPERDCTCYWDPQLDVDEEGEKVYGATDFDDKTGTYVVMVGSGSQTVGDAVETFAHELAHVAAGVDAGHGPEWERAFEAIFNEYRRIGKEMFRGPIEQQ